MHTHCVVINATHLDNGRWQSLHNDILFKQQKAVGDDLPKRAGSGGAAPGLRALRPGQMDNLNSGGYQSRRPPDLLQTAGARFWRRWEGNADGPGARARQP